MGCAQGAEKDASETDIMTYHNEKLIIALLWCDSIKGNDERKKTHFVENSFYFEFCFLNGAISSYVKTDVKRQIVASFFVWVIAVVM